MLAVISPWHYAGFTAFVLAALALDLGVFHRDSRKTTFREAMGWTALWAASAFAFAFVIAPRTIAGWDAEHTATFVTGYLVELSLSMDNVFVIALIFRYFAVPQEWQHRVLFWGIVGALVMRGLMIAVGATLIHQFHWMLYVFGVFLVYSGSKMMFAGDDDAAVEPDKNPAVKLVRRFFPLSPAFDGQNFVTHHAGRRMLTPLALVLVMVETTDVVFALDSIPAIFGVTSDAFLVFTSNVFAILGLRSLYFVLAGAIGYFRYLKIGLALVLVFIGGKMLIAHTSYKISTQLSLWIVAGIIGLSVLLSAAAAGREHRPK